ncbi:MAG TPA: 16S rRNA (cytidine(1402)-2'-O)-methyltransferase [Firmicutes bacterium]|jgi:16S rRNA (cytidine1402-2'-O)-methyltransferase|nr:16S rRNA (cytidine(1402)-2'-O)-methyltransferase [Bacillota bacterium]
MAGKLCFCATPIGNLGDITLRVLETLREADLIVAEDTRHTRKLLNHYDIHKPLLSCHEHNEAARTEEILQRVADGELVAVVSDAGMPGISDPGAQLIAGAIARQLPWTVLPGASAVLTGLLLSGLPAGQFAFLGFPPRRKKERRHWLESFKAVPLTLVFYEAPHRLADFLLDLFAVYGARPAALVREISKQYEEVERGTLEELSQLYASKMPRGEYVVVVEGGKAEQQGGLSLTDAVAQVRQLVATGQEPSMAIKKVSKEFGLSRREVYNSYHQSVGKDDMGLRG